MYIKNPLPLANANDITRKANGIINDIRPYMAPLTDPQKEGLRTMGAGREGLVRLISRIAVQHEQSLAREDNAGELVDKLEADTAIEGLRQAAIELTEMITDIQLSNSADIMLLTDAYTISLQASRKRDTALDSAMNEVDEWNKRYANKAPGTPTV